MPPQNVWQFLLLCFAWIGGRATRGLAILQGTLAIIAAQDGLLTQKQVSAVILFIAILTFWRGQATATTYASAQAIVKQAATPDVPLVNPIPPPTEPKP